ncbi:MAG: penicillin-binding transpeptidase domain-containing protein [Gemmatimonadaceae bacterium]
MDPDVPPPPPLRFKIVHVVLVLFALTLIGRAGYVQLWQHEHWSARAMRQQLAESSIPAARGDIEDANGLPIAYSRELVSLSVAPSEVKDFGTLTRAMTEAGIPRAEVRRATNRKRRWIEVRGRYLPSRVAPVTRLNGVHVTNVGDRVYVQSTGARQLLGAVGNGGRGVSGLELFLDSLLLGTEGRSRAVKGMRGQRFESPDMLTEPPGRGHTVRLTINQTLQNICDKALADAVARLRADGGDVVVMDPGTGEIRCLAGRRPGGQVAGVSALIEPYEPGSTLKPFFAARLLERGMAVPDEIIETYHGTYAVNGRVITDVHKADRMSLRDVIRFSSNVGIARFAERLSNGDVYELLRDLGFGSATGVPYPSEASGMLREPRHWSLQSHASLAIGYELSVTPLQLATAYAALGNGGLLPAPALIREIRDADGTVIYAHRPRILRRVFSAKAVNTVIPMLESVVDSGTATDAGLASFPLAGKSGTARRTVGGVYGRSTYTSTFVGLFPAKDAQYVVLAKIDNPREESIYGGKVAAPLSKVVIEGALAARDASLDWNQLIAQKREVDMMPAPDAPNVPAVSLPADSAGSAPPGAPRVPLIDSTPEPDPLPAVSIDLSRPLKENAGPPRAVIVPDVRGLPLRVAVRQLHRTGLLVSLVPGSGGSTSPAAGATVTAGTVVRLTRP